MPFTGPADASLPSNVKKMSTKKRKQWVAVFNSSFARCMAGKLPPAPAKDIGEKATAKECESRAFAIANGTVKALGYADVSFADLIEAGHAGDLDEALEGFTGFAELLTTGCNGAAPETEAEACMTDAPSVYRAYGGAQSFTDVRNYKKNQKLDYAVSDLWHVFDEILHNIQSNEELTGAEKVRLIQEASTELSSMMDEPEDSVEAIGFRERVKQAVRSLMGSSKESKGPQLESDGTAFFSWKDVAGVWRWMAVHSNKFKDRDEEIFPESAHLDFIKYVDETKDFPELWLWHTPGTRLGVAEMVDYVDGFVLSVGRFDEGREAEAKALHDMEEELGVSHGYRYPIESKQDKTIWMYRTFEVSPLPRSKEANVWTTFAAVARKEAAMPLTDEKRKFLVGVLGSEDKVTAIETGLADFSAHLEEHGVEWKEFRTVLAAAEAAEAEAEAPPAVAETPAPAPTAEGEEGEKPTEGEKPAEGEEGEKPAEGEAEASPPDEVGQRLTKLEEGQEKIASAVTKMAEAVKGLQVSDDDKLADLLSPRRPAPSQRKAASEDPENVLSDEDAEKIKGDEDEPPTNPISPYVEQLTGASATRRS